MNILLTGATGFVGKRLLNQFEKIGIEKKNIFLLTGREIEEYQCFLHKNYSYDRRLFQDVAFDVVIHMGATTPKGKTPQGMIDFTENIRSTLHLIKNLPNLPKCFIFGSTVSVYEQKGLTVTENTPLTVEDSYGLSKIVCERLLEEWATKNGVCLQILRFGPIYGPGEETYNKLAGTFLKKCMQNEEIHIFSDGKEYRSMIYVDDVCRMICNAMELEQYEGPINIVEERQISLEEIAKIAVKVSSSTTKIILDHKGTLRSDSFEATKMQRLLGNTQTSYEQGMMQLYKHLSR